MSALFWGVGSFQSRQQTRVAEVNGEVVNVETYRRAYNQLLESFRRVYGEQLDDNLLKMLRPGEQALNQLISRILMLQESERLNIKVDDQELANAIQAIPAFQNEGVFDYQRYQQLLRYNNMTTEQFEATQKQDLRIEKLRLLILAGVKITDEEALQWYQWNNAQANLDYAVFDTTRYNDIDPSPEEIAKYFKDNELKYQTDPQVKVQYLHFDPNLYRTEMQVTDEAVDEYYQSHTSEFMTEKTIEARHILFKVDEKSDPATVEEKRAKAHAVFNMAKEGKDFAELAKLHSEGPTSDKGGFLGAFTRSTMVKPFADVAFSMEAGQISKPVRTQFGWHVIKVEKINEESTQSLVSATPEIRKKLAEEQTRAKAMEAAETVYDSVFDGDDLSSAGIAKQVPVKETEFFTANGFKDPQISNPQQFAQVAFNLEKMTISQIQDWDDGYYLLQVVDRREAKIPDLESVAEKVREDVTKRRQGDRAKADAESLLEDVKTGKSLAEASQRFNVQVDETGFFKRAGGIPKIGYEPRISQVAFELSMDKPLAQQAIEGKQGWYVIHLKERKSPPKADYDKESAATIGRLVQQRKQAVFQRWVADLRARSAIDINQDLIQSQ